LLYVKGINETGSGHDIKLQKASGDSPNVSTPNMDATKL
jgi:hypothetical protein